MFLSAHLHAGDGEFNLPDIEEFQLENGIRLLIVPNYNNPVVYISAYINIGELDNPIDKIGLARFTFQQLVDASKKYPNKGQIKDKLFALGSDDGNFRYMEMDNTRGYIENYCLKEDTKECIELISEVIINPTFPEYGKFHSTNILYFTSPHHWYKDRYLAKLHSLNLFVNRFMYLNYNYLQRFYNDEDMQQWYNGHIRPENITLMITGDISPINIKKIVKEYFGTWISSKQIPEKREYPINISSDSGIKLRFINSKDRKDAKVRIITRGPSYNDNWKHAGDLAGIVFGSQYMDVDIGFTTNTTQKNTGFISRITKIHQKFNRYGELYSLNYSAPKLSYTMIHSDTKYSDLSRLYNEIKSEFENLLHNSITESELEQAKAMRINYYKTRLDHPEKFSHFIQDNYNNNGFSINTISTLDEEVNKVKLDETNAAAAKIFDPNNFMMVVIGNKDSCATFLEQFQDIEYYEQFEELDRQPERFFLRPYIIMSLTLILPILSILLVL